MSAEDRIAADRQVVTDHLEGRVTPETDPWIYDDDVLYFAALRLAKADRGWLEERAADPSRPASRRSWLRSALQVTAPGAGATAVIGFRAADGGLATEARTRRAGGPQEPEGETDGERH
ncbi:hypothetical protein BIV57_03640 [Mangrovactinospora gilvigrisea]|uniref:Uncharacterized protein n=1 Tax=Mangrovactinospora gilvigrisea TaxID=1428644 RepID=A0A1J7BJI6_9ACTN|nr:hypothetical protein [Mangrovactinospora gilvigrisea]OIV38843.1 hypothetical protein BIV57_03640 [Mangrovactinospora gilvigrisea]